MPFQSGFAKLLATICRRAWRGALFSIVSLAMMALSACGGGGDSESATPAAQQPSERALASSASDSNNLPGISVDLLIPTGVRRVSSTEFEFDYRIVLHNKGPAVKGVVVELADPGRGITVVDGLVNVASLAARSINVPPDQITIRKPLSVIFLLLKHQWRITMRPATIAGTAAVGAALANANVKVTDTSGSSVCAETTVVTSSTGAFSCTVLVGKSAPFLVVVTDPFAAYAPLVSVVTTTPDPATTLVVNATPLTTAIVGQLAPDGNALSVVANPALLDVSALATITSKVLAQIAPVLAALGAPANYDPFTTQIVAATPTQGGNTADTVIETLRFSTVAGVSMVATVDNPAGAVAVANATTPNPVPLTAPSPTLLSLSDSLRLITDAMANCFALPVSSRVLASNASIPATLGGPEATSLAPPCASIAHPAYLQNGYRLGQRYYGLLYDPAMAGATFKPAEIMLFIDDTTAADQDRAVVNIRYVDINGNVGNLIETVQKLPGSATGAHASDWWMYGNQQPVDTTVRSFVRRQEQFAPNPGAPGPFANSGTSRFEAGIELYINKDGPGSTGMRAARIIGPGLPAPGVVLTRPDPSIITDQSWLNVRRKDGLTDAASATYATDVGNIFKLERTQGLTGTAATTVRPNPNAGTGNATDFPNWAHPIDYGMPAGTPTESYIDFSQLRANAVYNVEIFYDNESAPRHTLTRRTLTPVTPATYAVNLQWVPLTPATLAYLDALGPLAGTQASIPLAWTANPYAETIGSAGVYTFGGGVSVLNGLVSVARGATTATAVAPSGTTFPALTTDGSSSRSIQLRYRMLDGSYKDAIARYN